MSPVRGGSGNEKDICLLPSGRIDELAFDLFDLLHALLSLSGLGRLVAELVDEHLHMGDLALLSGALGPHLLEIVLALVQILRVVACIGGDSAILNRGDMARRTRP